MRVTPGKEQELETDSSSPAKRGESPAARGSSAAIYGLAIFSSALLLLFQVQPLIAKIILPLVRWSHAAVWDRLPCVFPGRTSAGIFLRAFSDAQFFTRESISSPRSRSCRESSHLTDSAKGLLAANWAGESRSAYSPAPDGDCGPPVLSSFINEPFAPGLVFTVARKHHALSLLRALECRLTTCAAELSDSRRASRIELASGNELVGGIRRDRAPCVRAVAVFSAEAWIFYRSLAPAEGVESGARPDWKMQCLWIALAACGSALLLGVTNHITQNIASVPFLWVIPLCLYLLSFILCFDSDIWYQRGFFLRLLGVSLGGMTYALSPSFTGLPIKVLIPLYCIGLFVCCMFCHGELARLKPDPAHLTTFYLMCSFGGALGAAFVALLAPHVFSGYYELQFALGSLRRSGFDRESSRSRKPVLQSSLAAAMARACGPRDRDRRESWRHRAGTSSGRSTEREEFLRRVASGR